MVFFGDLLGAGDTACAFRCAAFADRVIKVHRTNCTMLFIVVAACMFIRADVSSTGRPGPRSRIQRHHKLGAEGHARQGVVRFR